MYFCIFLDSGSTSTFSVESAVATASVICSIFFLVVGIMVGVVCGHWATVKKSKNSNSDKSESTSQTATSAPVYEDLSASPDMDTRGKTIELKENIAYGPI